jgi:hypothetical protein
MSKGWLRREVAPLFQKENSKVAQKIWGIITNPCHPWLFWVIVLKPKRSLVRTKNLHRYLGIFVHQSRPLRRVRDNAYHRNHEALT